MVEMHVEGLSLDPQTRKPIVILRQNDGKGLLPLWIGWVKSSVHCRQHSLASLCNPP